MATIPPPTVQKTPASNAPQNLPPPPEPQASPPGQQAQAPAIANPPMAVPGPPPPPTRAKQKRRNRRTPGAATAAGTQVAPAASVPAPPPPQPAPRLGPLLTEEEQRTYIENIKKDLENAKKYLMIALARELSDEQKAIVEQVRGFIHQAEEAQKTDLVEARGLSQKASVLARDLAAAQ